MHVVHGDINGEEKTYSVIDVLVIKVLEHSDGLS